MGKMVVLPRKSDGFMMFHVIWTRKNDCLMGFEWDLNVDQLLTRWESTEADWEISDQNGVFHLQEWGFGQLTVVSIVG